MDLRWERHLLSAWHPGILAAVVLASVLAWFLGTVTTRMVLRVQDPWRRAIYLSLPVALVALFVFTLPSLLFQVGWRLTHPRYVYADLFMARYVLGVPFLLATLSGVREFIQARGVKPRT